MKKILLIFLLLYSFAGYSQLQLPYSIKNVNPVPVDFYYGPWANVAAAKAGVPLAVRYGGLTVMVTGSGLYQWLATDLTDAGLLPLQTITTQTMNNDAVITGNNKYIQFGTTASPLYSLSFNSTNTTYFLAPNDVTPLTLYATSATGSNLFRTLQFSSNYSATATAGSGHQIGYDFFNGSSLLRTIATQDFKWISPTNGAGYSGYTLNLLNNDVNVPTFDINTQLNNRARFYGPLRLQDYATGSLPTASNHPYSLAYDTSTGSVKFSNGSAWADIDSGGGGGGSGTVSPGTAGEVAVYTGSTTVDGTTDLPNGTTATTQSIGNKTDSIATNKFVRNQTEKAYNVEAFGARHDYQTNSTASITSGTDALTCSGCTFVSGDVGKSIRVFGAGSAGADLLTTIDGFTNATTISIATNASTSITTKQIEWGTNDTQPVQNAILEAWYNGGGTVFMPNGIYFFASALDWHGTGVNSQIYYPVTTTSETKNTIKILGESVIMWPSGPFGAQNLPTKGVIIKSVIVGSGTLPTVFGSATTVTAPIIENVCVITKSITGTTHVAPTMSAFILKEAGTKQLKNVIAITESDPTESVQPSAVTYGFWMTEIGQTDSHSMYENVTASSYYYGFRFEEHDWWSRVNSYSCLYGAVVAQSAGGGQGHLMGAGSGSFQALWCKYGIAFIGDRTIEMNYESEHWPGSLSPSYWFDAVADIYFPSSVNVSGKIRTNIENAGGTLVAPIISGTNTGKLNIHDVPSNITYGSGFIETYTGNTSASANALEITNSVTDGWSGLYLENNRGSFATFSGLYMGSSSATATTFGLTLADKTFLVNAGASGLGLAVGTRNAQPLYFGTNDTEKFRIESSGAWGLSGANYGTSGYVLTSQGSSSPPIWSPASGTGTVTSVNVSGGTTGLTFSGGPVTTSGTITMAGALIPGNGGTGLGTVDAWKLIAGGTASNAALQQVATGTAGQILVSGGSSALPSFVNNTKAFMAAASDEVTVLTTGTAKVTFRMPYALTLTGVRASLVTAQASGTIVTINVKENGTTIFSTNLTIDNTETTSTTAATPVVISDTSIADDSVITVDIVSLDGSTAAAGLKVTLIGY